MRFDTRNCVSDGFGGEITVQLSGECDVRFEIWDVRCEMGREGVREREG
jgi:hypothetical protein